ncbi:MAG: DUF1800 domain-containing protein [Blastocatellia bacterium]|nr:DUF1800 domain-containing protein [Blastocatellia bacterium]MCS7156659.1 DUF1800 domain-containing protein [Blastocatellia bacterium]MCX7751599.1 DUF1800 domain-containing protein [Blastocatellia bacterium]MDW8168699.1 DUF1800 domain-containing protein [Acidobacteriota bacterium]
MPLDEYDKIAHLLRRAGFTAHPDELEAATARGLQAVVEDLLNFERFPDVPPDPEILAALDQSQDTFNRMRGDFLNRLTRWWLHAMATTPRPLQEKMVLFWHGLFATSVAGLEFWQQIYLQNENFRGNFDPDTGQLLRPAPGNPFPVGNFRRMLEYLSKDPAMLYWLDNQFNVKKNNEVGSNENYARELHELFSMGVEDVVAKVPNYTERDIRQASRALTGWRVLPRSANFTFPRVFSFDPTRHDFGPYEHLGKRGGNNADFIFDNIVRHRNPGQKQSAVGRFLGYRLFTFFGYEDPEPEIINALADVFDGAHGGEPFNIRNMLRTIFTPGNLVSEAFYSERAFRARVKSPTEYVVSLVRLLTFDRATSRPEGISSSSAVMRLLSNGMVQMGQQLFAPPDVSGWREGLAWISTTSVLARFNFANDILALQVNQGGIDLTRLMTQARLQEALQQRRYGEVVDFLARLLWQIPPSAEAREALIGYLQAPIPNTSESTLVSQKIRGLIHLMLAAPDFQLS